MKLSQRNRMKAGGAHDISVGTTEASALFGQYLNGGNND